MALNSSGPISLAGTTAGQSIEIENGGNGTTQISLNDAAVRTLAGVASGAITMPTNFYGKSNRVTSSIVISANTTNYTLNTGKVTGYVAGKTDVTLTINAGVYVYSTSTGSYAFSVSGWTSGDTVTVINNGIIIGRGGDGGYGGYWISHAKSVDYINGQAGFGGGPAFFTNFATTVTNNNRIAGGGGGGGGSSSDSSGPYTGGGGGGGGGIGVSSGGQSGQYYWPGSYGSPTAGSAGTLTGAGSGGVSAFSRANGGTGGTYGANGSAGGTVSGGYIYTTGGSGGSAGACINGNTYITWVATGTRNGSIS